MDDQEMIKYRNSKNLFARKLGIEVTEIGPGRACATKTIRPDDLNPVGRAHGGCFFTLADTACGSAAATYGYLAVTLSASYNFLRGGMVGDVITAEAKEIKHGGTVSVYEAALSNQRGELVGTVSETFYTLNEKIQFESL